MTLADAGSQGHWLAHYEFQMDYDIYAYIFERYLTIQILLG